MPIQTAYADTIAVSYPGEVADLGLSDVISRDIETAGGVPFGVAVIQGTADRQAKLGTAGVFIGITVRDQTLVGDTHPDKYLVQETAGVMTRGVIWVLAGEAVVAGDVVYRTATGTLNKTAASNTLIAGARWETSAASGALARLRLV